MQQKLNLLVLPKVLMSLCFAWVMGRATVGSLEWLNLIPQRLSKLLVFEGGGSLSHTWPCLITSWCVTSNAATRRLTTQSLLMLLFSFMKDIHVVAAAVLPAEMSQCTEWHAMCKENPSLKYCYPAIGIASSASPARHAARSI